MPTIRHLRNNVLRLHSLATGRKILPRLEELNRSQWLSRDELTALQREKLLGLLDYAYRFVPYYKRVFAENGLHPDDIRKDIDCLKRLPILNKATVKEHWDELLTTEPQRRKSLTKLYTSGSTGLPLVFMQDTDFRDAVTADIQRHMGWAGWKMGDPQAVIWGAPFTQNLKRRLRTQMIDWTWNRIQINAFLMTDEVMKAFAEQIMRERPRILFGYASSLRRFAEYIQNSPYRGITFDGVFSGAELLLPAVRGLLEETFQCRVFNHYGTNELGGMACECEAHDGLHVSVENAYVEILHDGQPAGPGEIGDLVITNLNNHGMPFIRYSIGDGGSWHSDEACACGRALPRLTSLDGRKADAFQTRDGRFIWTGFTGAAFRCLTHPTIQHFQVVQKTLDLIVVRLVRKGEIPARVLDEITATMQAAFGAGVVVDFEYPEKIMPLKSGKHQYAVSEVPR